MEPNLAMVLVGLLIGAAAAGLIVFSLGVRARRALAEQITAAQAAREAAESARAVVVSRLEDLTARTTQLERDHQALAAEKVQLVADRASVGTTLDKVTRDLERESAAAAQLRQQLEERLQQHARLEGDHRVASAQRDSFERQVSELVQRAQVTEQANRQQANEIAELRARATGVETERNGLQERLAAQEQWFAEQTRLFEEKLVNLTNRMLEEKSQRFTEVNRKEIDAVVAPFQAQLKEFRERVDHIYSADTRDRGELQEKIRQLTELNQLVSKQAADLTNALTISAKSTGDWGEMILQRILEESGLREGHEYVLQQTVEGADEARQRPDAVIRLPDGKQVVVDSKVSNKAWKEYCAASDEATRDAKLAEHLSSVRAHMRELSSRDYQHSPDINTIEFVLMFVPIEAALLTALSRDESLFSDAWRARVYIVSPGMLMASLKLIEGMWVYQRRKESADKIAEAGRKLYDKLTAFAETFLAVGTAIDKAHAQFDKAQGQLATGKGNAIRLAEKMKKLGVTPGPGKVLPPPLVDLSEGEDEEEEVEEEEGVARLPGMPLGGASVEPGTE